MVTDRRTFLKGTGVVGIAGLAGCAGGPTESGSDGGDGGDGGSGDGGDGGGDSGGGDGGTEPSSEGTNVGMVYATGGLGDGSFNDQAQQGLFDAEEDFGVDYREVQPDEVAEFGPFQQQFAQSTDPDYDLVCCIGFLQTDALAETSESHPEQDFMLVDSVVESDNVANYTFAEHEGSFLVGQLAGLLTTTDFSAGAGETASGESTVGFVGGVESDLIGKFEAGFVAGVAEADGDVEVLTNYVGDFNDPTGGREAAIAMYQDGADVVYHAAGNTGTGVFQAAQEEGRFAIGVDQDQSVTRESYADVILASMVKRVDTAVYDAIGAVVDGDFPGGSIVELGLEREGVANVYGQALGSEIPESIKDAVAASRQAIVDGDISVPTDPEDV